MGVTNAKNIGICGAAAGVQRVMAVYKFRYKGVSSRWGQ
jgi:hypothetical protein